MSLNNNMGCVHRELAERFANNPESFTKSRVRSINNKGNITVFDQAFEKCPDCKEYVEYRWYVENPIEEK